MKAIRRFRSRALVAILVAVTLTVSLLVSPAAANVPVQHAGGIGCITDSQGKASVLWHPPSLAPGVVVFKADPPATVTGTDGLQPEVSLGGQAYTRVFGGSNSVFYTVHAAGPPSTPCEINLAFTEQPANITIATAEALSGRTGSVDGTTRAATVVGGATAPLPDAQTAVWYRWHGGDGPIDFTAIPHHTGTVLDDSDPFTSVGVAVFDAADPSTPLAVGGDGIAQPSGGSGGTASLQVSSASEYLVAVFSSGGTGNQLSNFGYTAAGAFSLSWNGPNSPPTPLDDNILTPDNTPVHFNVVGNDTDPDGDPITFAVTQTLPAHGTLQDTDGAGSFFYAPDAGFHGTDTFDYDVADDSGVHGTATVTIDVGGTPAPPPNDHFANAQPINVGDLVYGTTVSSTVETGEPVHHAGGGPANSGSVWYSFVPAVDGYVDLHVQTQLSGGSSPNLYARVYAATDPASATVDQLTDVEFFFAGGTYYVAVDSGADQRGPFQVGVEHRAAPTDDFANRVVVDPSQLVPNSSFVAGATHLATAEPNEPAHGGIPAARSNWAEILPFSQAGTLELTYSTFTHTPGAPWYLTDRNDNDGSLRLGVYTGNPSSFATLAAVPVTGTGPFTLHVIPGTSYYLAWDDLGASRYFTFGGTFTPDQTNQTGSVRADVTLEGGLALGEQACFELDGPGAPTSPKCVSSSPSSVEFQNVPLGSYSVAVHYQSTVGSTAVAQVPERFVVPAAAPVDVNQPGVAANVSVTVPMRKLLVTVQTGTLIPGAGFCFDLQPVFPSTAPPVSACDDSRGLGMILVSNLWADVQYVLRFTSAPDAYAVPAEQLVGPFDDTTELNRVDAPSGPAGAVHVNVTWQGGKSSTPFDLNGVCAFLSPGGPLVPVGPSEGCSQDDGTMSFDHVPVGDYQVEFLRLFWTASSQYVIPGSVHVSVTQGATASVDVQVPLRKVLVTVHTGTLIPGQGFCFDVIPQVPHGDVLKSSACDDARGLGLIGVGAVWDGVPNTLHFTSAPDVYALPPDQIIGPFDQTTELNRVDVFAGPGSNFIVNVFWEGGRIPSFLDLSSVCATLYEDGTTNVYFDPGNCLRSDGTMHFPHIPAGSYHVVFHSGGAFGFSPEYVLPPVSTVGFSAGAGLVGMTVTVELRRVVVLTSGVPAGTSGFCYELLPPNGTAAPTIGPLCKGAGLGVVFPRALRDVQYTVHTTAAPAGFAKPPDQTIGPFDETTLLNPVTMTSGPTGFARFSVLFEAGPPTPNTGSACFYLTGSNVVSGVQCTDANGELFFDDLPFGTYTTHVALDPQAPQHYLLPQGYVVPDSIDVGVSDVRQAPQGIVVPKRRLEVRAGSPTTGLQPGLCYHWLIRLSLLGDLPVGSFCDADDGASDGVATFGASAGQPVFNDTTYVLRVDSNPVVPASEQEKVLGPFDQTTNPQVVAVTTTDNHAPLAGDDNADAISGTDTVFGVRANDTDPDGDLLTLDSVSAPQHGTATIQLDRLEVAGIVIYDFGIRLHYTSDPTYSGPDSLTYTVRDNHDKTATATVAVTVHDGVRIFVSGADTICLPPEDPSQFVIYGCALTPVTREVPPEGLRIQVTRARMQTNELVPPPPVTILPSPGLTDVTLFAGGPAGFVHVTSVDASTNVGVGPACFAARQNGVTVAEQCTPAVTGFPEYYLGPIPVGITEVVETSVPPLYDPAPPVTVDVPQNIENGFGAGQGGFYVPNAPQVTMASTSFANDVDKDGVPNTNDNCSSVANPNQLDGDHDAIGDACDPTANVQSPLGPIAISAPGNPDATVVPSAVPLTPPSAPIGVSFPFGTLGFTIANVHLRATVQVTMQLPAAASGYWKLRNNQWVPFPSAVSGPNQLTITLQDGGVGDADGVANGVIVDPGAPSVNLAPGPYALRVSTSANRSNPTPLVGATLTGKVAIFLPVTTANIRSVDFSVDGQPYPQDTVAPFDLRGTAPSGAALLLSTRLLPDGVHTIDTRITLNNGTVKVRTTRFLTSNPRPATRELMVSTSSSRSNAQLLGFASVSGPVAVFVPGETGLATVEYYLDDPSMQPQNMVQRVAPYNYAGTNPNGSAKLATFSPGQHTMTARMVFGDGYVDVRSATFTVS